MKQSVLMEPEQEAGGSEAVSLETKAEPMYKDRMFRMIFKDKKELLSLYNAVSGRHYENPDELEINTLENAIYMKMKNDLSFVIDARISLYEHQSSYNPNMALRDLFYISDVYKILTKDENLYGRKLICLPTPQFVIFYNGIEKQPERRIFTLSDAYTVKQEEVNLELRVIALNINPGYNQELMENCKTLQDYMAYVSKVREYKDKMTLEEAVEQAIRECIAENRLVEFLSRNRAEAKNMSIYEYDEEKHIAQERAQAKEEGLEQGRELVNRLNMELARQGRIEDILRAAKDLEYQRKLMEEL